jgi:hypothetical protein
VSTVSESIPFDPDRDEGALDAHADADAAAELTHDDIERRAYEISQREDAGTADENWRRAERELRGRSR